MLHSVYPVKMIDARSTSHFQLLILFSPRARPQANVRIDACLTDRVKVKIWSASHDASEQQLREQSMKLRHTVNVETLQKE